MAEREVMGSARATLYMAGVAAVAVNSAVTWPWLGRIMSVDDLAALVTVVALSSVVSPIVVFGLHAFVLRRLVSADPEEVVLGREATAWACLFGLTVMGLGVVALLMGLSHLGVVAVWSGMTGLTLVAAAVLRGADKARGFAFHALTAQVAALILVGVLASGDRPLAASMAVSAVLAGFVSVACTVSTTAKPVLRTSALRRALRFALPLVPHLVLAVGLVQFMRVMLGATASATEVAQFQYAALVAGGAITVTQALSAHLTTDALRVESKVDFELALTAVSRRLYSTSLVALIGIAIFVALGLRWWLPHGVDPAMVTTGIAIMGPAAVVQGIGDVAAAGLMKSDRTARVSAATAAGALSAAAVYAIMTGLSISPVSSAALAVLLGLSGRALLAAYAVRKYVRVKWSLSRMQMAALVMSATMFTLLIVG